jgi:putative oxidoreductase
MTIRTVAEDWTARVLSILRIATGLVLLQHPIQKFFQFPVARPGPQAFSLVWFAGAIEMVLTPLLILGFLTRPVAFILSGELAFAYWIGHAPRGFYPSVNGGSLAIMYSFVCLYLAFAGGGPWSVDAALERRGTRLPV